MVGVLVLAINFGALSVLFALRSADGKHARATQCAREPVMEQVVRTAASPLLPARYRLSRQDVQRFRSTAPSGCPPRP